GHPLRRDVRQSGDRCAEARGPAAGDPQQPLPVRADVVRPCRGPGRRLWGRPRQADEGRLMRYVSTRGQAPAVGFVDAVLGGLAPDGGLYVPERWPQIPADEIAGFAAMPYAAVAARVIGAFADGEIDAREIAEMCEEAYAAFT